MGAGTNAGDDSRVRGIVARIPGETWHAISTSARRYGATGKLLSEGVARVSQRVGEEAVESVIAALSEDKARSVGEVVHPLSTSPCAWGIKSISQAVDLKTLGTQPVLKVTGAVPAKSM